MKDFDETAVRLWFFQEMIFAGPGLHTWAFSADGKLLHSTSSNETVFQMFLEIGGGLKYAMNHGRKQDQGGYRPMILSDRLGLFWIAEHIPVVQDMADFIVVLGPVFCGRTTQETVEHYLREESVSLELRKTCISLFSGLPVMPMETLLQYAAMLHFAAFGTSVDSRAFLLQSREEKSGEERNASRKPWEEQEISYEKEQIGSPQDDQYDEEMLILRCIRDGDLQVLEKLGPFEKLGREQYFGLGDPVREGKDRLLMNLSHYIRAAATGQVRYRRLHEMEREYVQKIEACKIPTELYELRRKMIVAFIEAVQEVKGKPDTSDAIRKCCEYIRVHYAEPLELPEIAKNLGYTDYYLTRKFRNETGIGMKEYITNIRMSYAKMWLVSTNWSLEDISAQLQFGSRAYFSRVFREREGISPNEYRERIRKGGQTAKQ